MARTATYLNFTNSTEAAFNFYKTVFNTEFSAPIMRMGDVPSPQELSAEQANLVMHVALPILGGHVLMGTDAPDENLIIGNNTSLNLEPDSLAETERLFSALSEGGSVTTPLAPQFWGGVFGQLTDRFGIQWMFNFVEGSA